MDKQTIRETLKVALLQFDAGLAETAAGYIVSDIIENVNFAEPNIAQHSLQWVAENFYKSHYLHAGWNDE